MDNGLLIIQLVCDDFQFFLHLNDVKLSVLKPFLFVFQFLHGLRKIEVWFGLIYFLSFVDLLQLPDFLHQKFIFFLKEVVLFVQIFIVQLQKVGIEPNFLGFQDELIFTFKLLSQKVVLINNLLPEFKQRITIISELVKLILQKLNFILVGHEQWFYVIELLKVILSIDEVDVLNGVCFAHGEPCLLA